MDRRSLFRLALALPLAAAAKPIRAQSAWPRAEDPNYWRFIRDQFVLPKDEVFFNTGTLGAMPRVVLDTVTRHMRELEETIARWDYKAETPTWFSGYSKEMALRNKLGELIHAKGEEIALTQNATMGMNFVAHGLNLQPGDEVILTNQEHPGGISAWQLRAHRHGIIVRELEIPIPPADPQRLVQLFSDAISPRTRVVAVPHITSRFGIVMPVKEICAEARRRGVFTVIDGAQSVGQLHVNVGDIGCDAYFSSPHKWLLAPPGSGLLYVRAARLDEVWTTLASNAWNDYAAGAYRLMQYGTGNLSLVRGFEAAVDFHMKIGPDRVERRIVSLANRLRDGLEAIDGVTIHTPTHPQLCAAMTTYCVDKLTGAQLQDELWNRAKIRVRNVGDREGVRHSVHIYNSEQEIDRTISIVRDLARG